MPTSADTLLRLVRALPLPASLTPTALGVDDWSFKRGSTYGTILVDLERRRVVDLLPDRRAETLAAWLRPRRRRHVKVVARDRSTEFSRGVELGATPRRAGCRSLAPAQKHARDAHPLALWRVRAAAPSTRHGICPPAASGHPHPAPSPRARTEQTASAASRARSLARYQEVRRRHIAGESLRAIKKATGWRGPPCVASPGPRASPSARCVRRNPVGWTHSSPGWQNGWPPDMRTPRRFTGSYANVATLAAVGRSIGGCRRNAPLQPRPRRRADAACHPC